MTTELLHIAVVASSGVKSDLFFADVLGCRKTEAKTVPVEIMAHLFGRDREGRIVNYQTEGIKFEVFIDEGLPRPPITMAHACLAVQDMEAKVKKARELGLEVRQFQKGAASITFIVDFDGNLYELKELGR
jgi:catechol 2,3-dioxygenase-like lactoylglutathione lyase family enzyme